MIYAISILAIFPHALWYQHYGASLPSFTYGTEHEKQKYANTAKLVIFSSQRASPI
jgi:hypothetical protein